MNKMKLLFAMLMLVGFIACGDDEDPMTVVPPTCETEGLTYNNDIAAMFNAGCAVSGCHASNTTTTFPMGTYDEAFAAVGFGRIIGALNHETGFSAMPRGAEKLDDCTIDKVTAWINDGAPE